MVFFVKYSFRFSFQIQFVYVMYLCMGHESEVDVE